MNSSRKRSLEGYKIFPFIAWSIVIGFAVFVYNLNSEIERVTTQLQSPSLEQQIITSGIEDVDFEAYTENQQRSGI